MLGNFSLLTHPCDMSSFLKKRRRKFSIRLQASTMGWDETNTTFATMTLILQQGCVCVFSVPCAFWNLTIFTSFEFIATYITLIGFVSLSVVLFVIHEWGNVPFSASGVTSRFPFCLLFLEMITS